jgi:hypothetical protein
MSDSLSLLDEALDIGYEELEHLRRGREDEAGQAARRRGELMEIAWERREGMDVDAMLDKLEQLKSLQGALTSEAKKLHEVLRRDLAKAKQENRRIFAYNGSRKSAPRFSRFISKQG